MEQGTPLVRGGVISVCNFAHHPAAAAVDAPGGSIRRIKSLCAPGAGARLTSLPVTPAASPSRSPALSVHAIESAVRSEVVSLVGADVDFGKPLMAAGLDSLLALELTQQLSTAFGIQLPSTLAFDFPTVEAIAVSIAATVNGGVGLGGGGCGGGGGGGGGSGGGGGGSGGGVGGGGGGGSEDHRIDGMLTDMFPSRAVRLDRRVTSSADTPVYIGAAAGRHATIIDGREEPPHPSTSQLNLSRLVTESRMCVPQIVLTSTPKGGGL